MAESEGTTLRDRGLFLLGPEPSRGWSSFLDLSFMLRCPRHAQPTVSIHPERPATQSPKYSRTGDALPRVTWLPALTHQLQDPKQRVTRIATSCPANEIWPSYCRPACCLSGCFREEIQNELLIDHRSKRCEGVTTLSFLAPALGISHPGCRARESHCRCSQPCPPEISIPLRFKRKVCVCARVCVNVHTHY